MALERSEASPYKSRFGGGWMTPVMYLAEGMCDRQARAKNKGLVDHFWTKPPWNREFKMQARNAAALLKLYSPEAIMRALRTPKGKKAYSLAAPWLDPLIKEEQEILDRNQQKLEAAIASATEAPAPKVTEKPRPAFVPKQSKLNKLRNLDNGSE